MRIQTNDTGAVSEREKVSAPSAPTAATAASETEAPVAAQSAVVVSAGASDLAARSARGKEAQAERIGRVRAAVSDGSYKPDLDKLAQKFVDEEMGGTKR